MTNRTAANRYGRALLDVAVKEKADLEGIERDLAGFVALLDQYPTLQKVMLNPAVPVPRKSAVVAELATRTEVSPILAKLLVLLAGRDRLVLLTDLLAAYRDRLLDYRKVVRAHITTAAPLSAERAKAVEQKLATITGKTVTLDTIVDPSIIGGVIARIGSTVYDGSVARQLEKMKTQLVQSN